VAHVRETEGDTSSAEHSVPYVVRLRLRTTF